LVRWDANTEHSIGPLYDLGVTPDPFTTELVTLRCVGDQISLLYDGVTVIGPITEAAYQDNEYVAIRLFTNTSATQHRLTTFDAVPVEVVAPSAPVVKAVLGRTEWGNNVCSYSTAGAGIAVGDLIVMAEHAWSGFFFANDDPSRAFAAGGSTWLTAQEVVWGNTPYGGLFYKVATSADVAATAFTFSAVDGSGNNGGSVVVFEAGTFNVAAPLADWEFVRHTGSAATTAIAALTVDTDNSLAVVSLAVDRDVGSTPPAGFDELLDAEGGAWGSVSVSSREYDTGTTGALTHTASSAWGGQGGGVAYVVRPPA
jgi:hypothetical protein